MFFLFFYSFIFLFFSTFAHYLYRKEMDNKQSTLELGDPAPCDLLETPAPVNRWNGLPVNRV